MVVCPLRRSRMPCKYIDEHATCYSVDVGTHISIQADGEVQESTETKGIRIKGGKRPTEQYNKNCKTDEDNNAKVKELHKEIGDLSAVLERARKSRLRTDECVNQNGETVVVEGYMLVSVDLGPSPATNGDIHMNGQMRFLFLAALTVGAATCFSSGVDKVWKGWDLSKRVVIYGSETGNQTDGAIPLEEPLVLAAMPCPAGYTGDTCTNPICTSENMNLPPATAGYQQIESTVLSNCAQKYVVMVDETLRNIRIRLSADLNVNPQFTLQDSNERNVIEDDIWEQTPQMFDLLYYELPPGLYTVVPKADAAIHCNLQMQAESLYPTGSLTVYGGFTYSQRNDYPQQVVTVNTPVTVAVHADNNKSPGALKTINFVGTQNTFYPAKDLNLRYGCGYEYYQDFACVVPGEHFFQVQGVTHLGFGFRRIVTFDCLPDTNNTVITTTQATTPKLCKNGAMRVNNLDGTSYCFCLGLWTGNDCGQRLCMNGGTLQSDNTCKCPVGYNGDHCEAVFCMDIDGFGFSANSPTLTLVVRGRQQMNNVIQAMTSATTDFISSLQFDPTYITTYILIIFNNNQFIRSKRYIDLNELLTDLANDQKSFTSDGDCSDSVFSAISQALNMYPNNKSPMYVFTDGTPNDAAMAETIVHQLAYWRVPINVVFVPTTATCSMTLDDPNYRALDNLSKKSMGATFYMSNATRVYDFTYDHMLKTVYRSQLMLSNDIDSCSGANPYQSVTVENLVQELVVVGVGSNLALTLTAPETDIPPIKIDPLYTDGVNFIWSFNRVTTGSWLVGLNSSVPNGPCSFKVYQKSFHGASAQNTQYDMFWAVTGAIDSDGPTGNPIVGFDMGISIHLTNYPDYIPPQYIQAGLTIYASRNRQQVELYASNGIWRDGCSYNFYFPPFTCSVGDETLYFNFYARDELGMAIQRAGVMNCMHYEATPRPPGDCLNGGVPTGNNGTNGTTCYCPMGFTGTHCEKIICYNGGTPNGQMCKCTVGWSGPFCNWATCIERGPDPDILINYVDMVFAVEMTQNGQSQLAMLNQNFPQLLRDINSQDKNWIRNFVLVGYNSTWGDVIHVSPAFNPAGIIVAMNRTATQLYTDNGCTVQLYRALNRAIMKGTTPPGSFIEIFTATPADSTKNGGWGQLYESVRSLYLTAYGFLAVMKQSDRNPTGLFCNATYDQHTLLFDLVGGSTGAGEVYPAQSGTIVDLMKVIPLQYLSGLVYSQVQTDCTAPMQVYFPVDAYTQTIFLTVVGNNTQIHVYDAQNREVEYFQFMHDTISMWDLYEIRKPCDSNWTEFGQYCTYFESQKMTWNDAQNFCAQSGGFLVDDLNDDSHRFLQNVANSNSYWMGLHNFGDGYVWDRGNNNVTTFNQTDTFWAGGGGTPAYDPTKQCVYWDSTARDGNTWTPDACSTPRPFICQKHRYDQNSPPTSLDSNHLPAGMWYINVTTSAPPGISNVAGCFAEVRLQSKLQIYTGFVTNQAVDFPGNDPINDSPNNMVITYIHTEDHDNRTPIMKYAMMYDAYNGTFYNAAQYQYRSECSFSWISQKFPCPNANSDMNEFAIAHVGEDEFGNMFQRVTLAHCRQETLTCGNGGYRYNGMCICDEYWTGTYCTVPICVNGGTLDSNTDQFCRCPVGYAGPNCQFDECLPRIPYDFTADNRTLIVMLEATVLNQPVFTQFTNYFASMLNASLQIDPSWFVNYALITFDSNDIVYSHYTYTNPQALQVAIGYQAKAITDPGACQSNIYKVLKQTLMQHDQIAYPNSQILLVTSSTAKDYMTRTDTIEQLSNSEANLHWLYMASTTCGNIPSDDSVPHLVKMSYASNGNALFLKSDNIISFLSPYMASRVGAQTLDNPTVGSVNQTNTLTCPSGKWLVQVDKNTTSIYVTFNSMFGQVGFINPNRDNMIPQQLFNVSGQTQLYMINTNGLGGLYTVTLSSPGTCFVSIYGVGGTSIFTRFAPTTSRDPNGAHTDGMATTPFSNVSSTATFHLAGTPGHRAQLQYLEVLDVNTGLNIIRSELYRRAGCSFEYYSDPFTCPADIVTLYIYGLDENYIQFRRQQMSFCINGVLPTLPPITDSTLPPTTTVPTSPTSPTTTGTTTPTPPTTTSFGNLNLVFDVVFLIDVSQSAANTYDDMSSFISTLMSGYTISLQNARTAIIPVMGAATPMTFPVAFLNSITSKTLLDKYLDDTKTYFSDFDDNGQNLQQALNEATTSNFLSSGYRPSQTNHLLIYVTSTSTFSDNPSTTSILSQNTYGIITVGYGPGITNGAALQALAGGAGCYFNAAQANDLVTKVIPSIQTLIWNANFNKGSYCGNGPAN